MPNVTQPIRQEHEGFAAQFESIRRAADALDDTPLHEMKTVADGIISFLAEHLIPHARGEDDVLYPLLDKLAGRGMTAAFARDHVEVVRGTDQLRALRKLMEGPITSPAQLKAIRRDMTRILYTLYQTLSLHLAKEEELLLPVLDQRLSEGEAADLFERMGHAAADTRARAA